MEMEALNKYMINKLAGLLEVAFEEDWFKVYCLWHQSQGYCIDWDAAVPDKREIQACYAAELFRLMELREELRKK
jgi:hypothetical protein